MKRLILLGTILLLLVGSGGAAAYLFRSKEPASGPTHVVRRGDLVETAAASGTIEPHVQVEVKSRASGEVIEVLVQEGATVEAGQLLVRLDPADAERAVREAEVAERRARADLAQARAQLTMAEAEAGEAGANREVQERGRELGIVSQEQQRTASHGARVASSNVALRRAQVQGSQAALQTAQLGVDNAARRLREMEIRAPIAGTVLSVPIEVGSIVSSAVTNVSGGTTLLTLADLADLRVRGAIDEAQIGRVRVDQPVIIRVDAYPEQELEGRVTRVAPLGVATSNVVTFDVEIAITDENASILRSGMSADLEIITVRREGVLMVPLTAVHSRGAQRFVRLAGGEERRIVTGATDGMRLEVLEGVAEGDELDLAAREMAAPRQQGGSLIPMGRPGRSGGGGGGRGGGGPR
jgi:HlyD family secretion protein